MNIQFKAIAQTISDSIHEDFQITKSTPISGGDINEVFQLETSLGIKCIKINTESNLPQLFETELKGLQELAASNTLNVVQPILCGATNNNSFLLLDFIETGTPGDNFWTDFGIQLAKMHQQSSTHFGAQHDNYIGSLKQLNEQREYWHEFYYECRLAPLISMAIQLNLLESVDLEHFENFRLKLPELFPEEVPALLHGDLWNGNYMVNTVGEPVLIDPAVYYGHREMDLAMTKLFGGGCAIAFL